MRDPSMLSWVLIVCHAGHELVDCTMHGGACVRIPYLATVKKSIKVFPLGLQVQGL